MAKPASTLARRADDLMNWIDKRLPVTAFWNATMTGYYAPKNFNFWYYMGSLALLVLVMQIVTGNFSDHALQAFGGGGFRVRRVHHARCRLGLADSLYAFHRCFVLFHPGLSAHVPQPVVRFASQAKRIAVDFWDVDLPCTDGGSFHGLYSALGPDVLLGSAGHHQPVRRHSQHWGTADRMDQG